MTSLAHGPLCCHADGPGRVVPGTRSARPANASRTAQHVEPCTCAHMGDPCFPNSNSSIRLHFSRPHGLVPSAECFSAGSRSRKRPWLGGLQSTGQISHTASRRAGTVSEITPSVTQPTTPVWVGPCPISTYALTHAMLLAVCTHSWKIILGARVGPKDPGVSIPPKLGMYPFTSCNGSTSSRSYRTHLVMAHLEGAYRLPLFLWEVNPTSHWVPIHSASSTPMSPTSSMCVCAPL